MKKILGSILLILAASANANECELTIESNDMMQFSTKSLTAPKSCKEVTVTLKHTGKLPKNAMGHNWVLSKQADIPDIASDGMGAGLDKNYLKEGDSRVLAATKIIGGGEQTSVTFASNLLKEGENYAFFCSYPGHYAIMQGTFTLI
ncbi:azurin [uncultured Pseudoalteromonas sp.]|uniref:azurin n=1 Tax=Pseudoalteromonas sp. DY56-GL22 TaxID=2967126 RepID=UPI002630D607|nr:azurin [uncultured Pseudoalteromonas sp.]